MRTKERWNSRVREQHFKHFSPRIQKDLKEIPFVRVPAKIESIFIYGKTETGKTILAAFMLLAEQREIYLRGGPEHDWDKCKFISAPDLFMQIKETYNSDSDKTEKEIVDFYRNIHLLVLDDFGTTKPTDWVLQILYSILNFRYENLKKTIITSNLDLNEIAEILGDDRLSSRIKRMCQVKKKLKFRTTT